MAATIKDIANRTGLGLATISSYLNGGNVREKNRIKIEEAIRELNFEVNEVARGLKTNRTNTIGVVIPELNNVFCTEIITGMEDILRKKGYATIVCDCRTDKTLEKDAVEFLHRKRVDGIINMPVDSTGAHLEIFQNSGKPIVLIDRKIPGVEADSVLVDNVEAARKATALLLEKGHRKIAMVAGPVEVYTALERVKGYRKAYEEAGIEVDESLILHCDFTIQGASNVVNQLLEQNSDATAIFAANYEMTMGTMIALNEHGIEIPKTMSVIGFDNVEFAKALHPTLTIVTQPTAEIAVRVAETILNRIENPAKDRSADSKDNQEKEQLLQTELLFGKSIQER